MLFRNDWSQIDESTRSLQATMEAHDRRCTAQREAITHHISPWRQQRERARAAASDLMGLRRSLRQRIADTRRHNRRLTLHACRQHLSISQLQLIHRLLRIWHGVRRRAAACRKAVVAGLARLQQWTFGRRPQGRGEDDSRRGKG